MGAVDESTEVAVGISQRDRGHATRPSGPPCGTVSNGLESVNSPGLQDACVQRHHRQHRIGLAGQGIDAVKRRARPQQVEMVVGAEEDARRVGKRGRCARHGLHEGAEARELLAVDRVVRLLRHHQVAHQQSEPQPAQSAALVDQDLGLLRAEAQTVHAGVDVDHRVERPVEALRGGAPGIELAEMVEHRRQPVLDEVALGAGQQAVQDIDRVLGQHGAKRNAFVDMGDEELPAAFGRRAAGRRSPRRCRRHRPSARRRSRPAGRWRGPRRAARASWRRWRRDRSSGSRRRVASRRRPRGKASIRPRRRARPAVRRRPPGCRTW